MKEPGRNGRSGSATGGVEGVAVAVAVAVAVGAAGAVTAAWKKAR
jgi:hypothetical protein